MPDETFEEKTEQPTPRKRQEVREKGEVAKSRELPSVAVLVAALVTLTVFGSYMSANLQLMMKDAFSLNISSNMEINDFLPFGRDMINAFLLLVLPVFVAILITAVLSNTIQVGFLVSGEQIKPKFSKVDPIKGFKRLFSKQSFMELLKSLIKLFIVGAVAYVTIRHEMEHVPSFGEMELTSIISYILRTIFTLFIRCTLAMIFIVIMDYAFQRWEFEQRIKMTKKEVKDEYKRTEGDPLVKSRIKSIQMQMARQRMMQKVPEADVVISNPTHLANALKYDHAEMDAPRLVAKGAGEVARKIREIAEEHHIPIIENRPLAKSLYSLVELGHEIPPSLYQAVAEVLAYIYRLRGRQTATP
jgi:flagellar biosynthetic protein FlhB